MDYIAIDFETANANLTSACSIGLVGVTNDKIVFEEHYLINPHQEFSSYNTFIHGITEGDVSEVGGFDELWPKIKKYFNNTLIFAHAANFDIEVLKALIDEYDLEIPNIKIGCTLKIAKKIWKDELPNCKLNTISSYLNVEHNHHNALSDAYICTEIIKRAKRSYNVASEEELFDVLGLAFGVYNDSSYRCPSNKYKKAKGAINKESVIKDCIISYSGKPLTITRKELHEKLLINGALISLGPVVCLDYFIKLEGCKKAKLERVEEYIRKGSKMKIITEEEILRMIK